MKANINNSDRQISEDPHSLNLWDYKPWWCQPWSIILTGILVTISVAIVTKIIWVRLLVFVAILAWWTYFLVLVPKMIKNSSLSRERSDSVENSTVVEEDRSQSYY